MHDYLLISAIFYFSGETKEKINWNEIFLKNEHEKPLLFLSTSSHERRNSTYLKSLINIF